MTLEKWQTFSLAQQLGNIGSEISRAQHWEQKNDLTSRNQALERALDLVDLTLADQKHIKRFKEITRLREIISDLWQQNREYDVSLTDLSAILLDYGILARS